MRRNGIRWAVLLMAALLLCASCIRRRAEEPSATVGVGRVPKTETVTDPGIEPPEPQQQTQTQPQPDVSGNEPQGQPDQQGQQTADPTPQTNPEPAPQTDPEPEPQPQQQVTADPEPQPQPVEQPTYVSIPSDPDSLAPFGAIKWYLLNGRYVYEMPKQNNAGEQTMWEMYDWPKTYWEDKNQDNNDWYPGKINYNPATGEKETVYDRFGSTLEVLKKYGAIYRGDTSRKVIYLTFDCGYEAGATEKILDTLKAKGVPATFFVTGPYVRGKSNDFTKEYIQGLIRRMLDEGHIVGNHTNTHPVMADPDAERQLTVDEVIDEMRQVEQSYKEAFPDAPDMLYFRPPQGAANEWLIRIEAKLGYRTVFWSFAYNDWRQYSQPDPAEALGKMKAGMYPGCVYLLHAESTTNAEVLGDFIDWVYAQGFTIEPLCGIE